jgi:molecular chaperone GrpE (heat shock protein)
MGKSRNGSIEGQDALAISARCDLGSTMSTLQQLENQVKRLNRADQEALRDWLENLLEDELEFTDEFKAKIERGEQDLRAGRVRVRKP